MEITKGYKYIPAFIPGKAVKENDWALVLTDKKLLMKKNKEKYSIPAAEEVNSFITKAEDYVFIGRYEEHDCYGIRNMEMKVEADGFELVEIREITEYSGDPGLFILAGAANHILHWSSMNRYCGRCGGKTLNKAEERAKVCPDCGNTIYPRISPAIITAIFREDQILLAHNGNFKKGLYSLIAGYVEPGESLEQCVEREIFEEVGIKVKNIKYFGSQPWSFPDSLMMAFTAEYESGEIQVDNVEITDAGWYDAQCMPCIPSADSVAGKIIRWYLKDRTDK